jgi:DNA-binding response OmpR family regulator
MTSRILVADDSLTIQKVIAITLANSGYELVECLNETELFRKIQSNHFDLILLDFNLSDSRSGYDLSKQINQILPGAAIIVMLGTFDSIDELQFELCGITDKIVKPFESSKFIKKCRDLLEDTKSALPVKKSLPESLVKTDDLDLWKVDAPRVLTSQSDTNEKDFLINSPNSNPLLDPLNNEIEGWGFSPNVSLEEKFNKVFPPVIEEASIDNVLSRLEESSQFVNNSEFNFDNDLGSDLSVTNPIFEIPEDLNRHLLNEIEDDVSTDNFWAVDEIVEVKSEDAEDISSSDLDEVTEDLTESVQAFHNQMKGINHEDELLEKLAIKFKPMIEEMVKEFCRQSAEKVAWEIIPDLAENLIRKEIKEISNSF